jgi:menaquinone-9 beta-reductase
MFLMDSCDALIVGGGPAGSSCAWQLRRYGLDVVVMDRTDFPRDKVCAGWITPAVIDSLQLDVADYARQHVLQPITAFRTGLIDGGSVKVGYRSAVSYGIRRYELDNYLLQRSQARLWTGQALKSLEKRGKLWFANDAISAPLVIGAGGHFCPVARFMGAKLGADDHAIAAKEIEFEMSPLQSDTCRVLGDTPELYFCRDLKGYGWCFRKGNYLNIGLGREGGHGLSDHLGHFCDFLAQTGRIPGQMPHRFHGHAYLLYGHAERKRIDDGLLLIGDAAGLACPQSGEGIRPAVESALMASDAILSAGKDYRAERLLPYAQQLTRRFGKGKPAVTGPVRHAVSRMLLNSAWFTRHVVLDRWFLHTHQKALQPNRVYL